MTRGGGGGGGANKAYEPGAPVAQWVKRWPPDLAVPSSSPARGEIFSTINGSTTHSLSLSSAHRTDMTEILSERT